MDELKINSFIEDYVIRQPANFFERDISDNYMFLKTAIIDKKVLIVGGAGTIGSNYIKEILNFKPSKLVVVDSNENSLTELTRTLRSGKLLDYNTEFITYPVNLLSDTFDKIFHSDHFDIIANFSAHKHVRSEKDIYSIEALIKNNVYGAIKLLSFCTSRPPSYFFSVSTDKATNPVNIMGASKAIMEKLIISKKNEFRVTSARFANVAFSNGSLLEGYLNRINKKQALSCPKDIKRFFVTPKQSGQICLLATFLGESGDIFFPKLNSQKDQVYFKEITLKFLKFLGYDTYLAKSESLAKNFRFDSNKNQYPVYFFDTNTAGEKSFEEFFDKNDKCDSTTFTSMGIIKNSNCEISHENVLNKFNKAFSSKDLTKNKIIEIITKFVPDFNHKETHKGLDQKM